MSMAETGLRAVRARFDTAFALRRPASAGARSSLPPSRPSRRRGTRDSQDAHSARTAGNLRTHRNQRFFTAPSLSLGLRVSMDRRAQERRQTSVLKWLRRSGANVSAPIGAAWPDPPSRGGFASSDPRGAPISLLSTRVQTGRFRSDRSANRSGTRCGPRRNSDESVDNVPPEAAGSLRRNALRGRVSGPQSGIDRQRHDHRRARPAWTNGSARPSGSAQGASPGTYSITSTPSGGRSTKTSAAGSRLTRTPSKRIQVTLPNRSATEVARTSPSRVATSSRCS